jgi:hypothetical protein
MSILFGNLFLECLRLCLRVLFNQFPNDGFHLKSFDLLSFETKNLEVLGTNPGSKTLRIWNFEQKNDLELHFLMLDTTQENFLFVFSGILRVLDVLGAKKKLEFLFFRNPKIFGCVGCQEKHLRVPFFSGILRILDVLAVLCVQKKIP